MRSIIISSCVLLCTLTLQAQAQNYTVGMTSGTLNIQGLNHFVLEGYNGEEVIFEVEKGDFNYPRRADGLQPLSARGKKDNTKIGLSIERRENELIVHPISQMKEVEYYIRVPKGLNVKFNHDSHFGKNAVLRNLAGELEVNTNFMEVTIEEITGPITASTVHGEMEVTFSELSQKAPSSLVCAYGNLDITLPPSTRADMKLKTGFGEVFTDLDIEIEESSDEQRSGDAEDIPMFHPPQFGHEFKGTLNGGGVMFSARAQHGNIYLRKK